MPTAFKKKKCILAIRGLVYKNFLAEHTPGPLIYESLVPWCTTSAQPNDDALEYHAAWCLKSLTFYTVSLCQQQTVPTYFHTFLPQPFCTVMANPYISACCIANHLFQEIILILHGY